MYIVLTICVFFIYFRNRMTVDDCLEHKWLQLSSDMTKMRKENVFMSLKLRNFAKQYEEQKGSASRLSPIASGLNDIPERKFKLPSNSEIKENKKYGWTSEAYETKSKEKSSYDKYASANYGKSLSRNLSSLSNSPETDMDLNFNWKSKYSQNQSYTDTKMSGYKQRSTEDFSYKKEFDLPRQQRTIDSLRQNKTADSVRQNKTADSLWQNKSFTDDLPRQNKSFTDDLPTYSAKPRETIIGSQKSSKTAMATSKETSTMQKSQTTDYKSLLEESRAAVQESRKYIGASAKSALAGTSERMKYSSSLSTDEGLGIKEDNRKLGTASRIDMRKELSIDDDYYMASEMKGLNKSYKSVTRETLPSRDLSASITKKMSNSISSSREASFEVDETKDLLSSIRGEQSSFDLKESTLMREKQESFSATTESKSLMKEKNLYSATNETNLISEKAQPIVDKEKPFYTATLESSATMQERQAYSSKDESAFMSNGAQFQTSAIETKSMRQEIQTVTASKDYNSQLQEQKQYSNVASISDQSAVIKTASSSSFQNSNIASSNNREHHLMANASETVETMSRTSNQEVNISSNAESYTGEEMTVSKTESIIQKK